MFFNPRSVNLFDLGILTSLAYLGFCKEGAWHKWPNGKYGSDWHYAT